ncbi:MAG: baseplate J/gp47 family protein [Chloroflexi bacterium]|nr:baseplate J/gp47 family protein [Chloroflexota bacterium]
MVGRIDTATEPDIMLFVPRRARALRSATAWAHVAAHVRRRGISLGIVSPRGDVRANARANGLRAARSPRGLRRGPWRLQLGGRRFLIPKPRLGSSFRGLLLLAAVALAGVAACYQLPSARIAVVPASEPFSRQAQVRPQPLTETPDVSLAIVPAEGVELEISATLATVPTGETEIGDERAATVLLFSNAGGAHVELPAGTIARTASGTAFLTDEPLVVPPGGSAEVGAAAEFLGVDGNVAPGEIGLLDTELPPTLSVVNPVAAEGGTNIPVPAVAQEDVDRLRDLAPEVLARAGIRELRARAGEATLIEATVGIVILTEQPQALLGEAADIFLMEYTALASGLTVTEAAADAYGRLLLEEALPDGVALLPDTVSAALSAAAEGEGGGLLLRAEGRVHAVPDLEPLRAELTGLEPAVAAARLAERLGLEETPRVTLEPEWVPWRWTPRRADRIAVDFVGTLEEPEEDDEVEDGEQEEPEGEASGENEEESRSPAGPGATPLLAAAAAGTRARARRG